MLVKDRFVANGIFLEQKSGKKNVSKQNFLQLSEKQDKQNLDE